MRAPALALVLLLPVAGCSLLPRTEPVTLSDGRPGMGTVNTRLPEYWPGKSSMPRGIGLASPTN